jgi:diaminopimelate epimerase
MRIAKAHAYGNDFLYVQADEAASCTDLPGLARAACARHDGVGADGVILYRATASGASMRLLNADGSPSEVSGNGVRGLAALLARWRDLRPGDAAAASLVIDTDAGPKTLDLVEREGDRRFRFRAAMGHPANLRRLDLDVAGETIQVGALSVGNPQCVLLAPLDAGRLARIGPALQTHAAFPEGVNVEIAQVEAPDRTRILIWERGVGPTMSSGTGSCASAVVAAAFGGAARTQDVIAPGGTQRVEWGDGGLVLTGWAEAVLEGEWLR